MPQLQLPIFSAGITLITNELGFECRDGTVTYFTGQMPVFGTRPMTSGVRMIISQFVVNGTRGNRRSRAPSGFRWPT
jgi:hypothetical protein